MKQFYFLKGRIPRFLLFLLAFFWLSSISTYTYAARQMERLDRGVVAVKVNNGVFVSWRYLGTDDPSISFNVYRDGKKVNGSPITKNTNLNDAGGTTGSKYVVKAVLNGMEVEASKETTVWGSNRKTLKLRRPGNNYAPNDMSVGDVDGDGQYELFIKWDPSNQKDNSQSGVTGNVYIDCYRLDGTFLWRIDLGRNIRAGAHYTQFQVYDYDGDGKCELACKTAPGTKDGKGKNVIMGKDDPNKDYRNGSGYILSGPEYLTMFNGLTGAEMSTVAYKPARGNVNSWGDGYGNRVDRFLACTAFLDGVHPSLVMCRGYYTRSTLAAYDFKGGKLVERWFHDSPNRGQGAYGEGNHNISVADVDGDGFDEIIYGSACIDHNGKTLYRTGFGHGDAMHVSDLDPSRPGLEGWFVHEEKGSAYGYEMRDLKTGKVIWGKKTGTDNGRGMSADIDAKHPGFECWSSAGSEVFDCKGKVISNKKPSVNFRVYWDGDLQDELLDGNKIDKWNGNGTSRLATLTGNACNGSKNTPNLSADILGDWREEVILHNGSDEIYIYTTTIPSDNRMFTLMHDPVYRMGICWQNTAYNQPPHLGIYIGGGLKNVKQPDIFVPGGTAIVQRPAEDAMTVEGSKIQVLLKGFALSPVKIALGGDVKEVKADGLPAGVTLKKQNDEYVIEGVPSQSAEIVITSVGGDKSFKETIKITVIDDDRHKVAYVTDPDGGNYKLDAILPMLKAQEDLYVGEINANDANVDLSGYDLIVISEVAGSGTALMPKLKGYAKPMLSMKVHAYKNSVWDWAANGFGDNMEATNVVVPQGMKRHPIFKDVNFINDSEVQMLSTVSTKGLTYMNPESLKDASGDISAMGSVKGEEQVSIFEIKKDASVGGTTIKENYVQIGLNSSSYANLTTDGLSVVKNACYYLLGVNVAEEGEQTSIDLDKAEFNGVTIYPNPIDKVFFIRLGSDFSGKALVLIYSISGVLVQSGSVDVESGVARCEVNNSDALSGEFIAKVACGSKVYVQKVILE